jgi:hypothetical protein
MLRYVDTAIEHVPVADKASVLWSSNWTPYIWSVRNILASEVAHTALACWQSGRRDAAWSLWRGAILDAMYASRVPGNCAGTSEHDGRWGGACTDFCCSVGMFGRGLVEGLFGIVPSLLDGELLIRPGLPPEWDSASIDTPQVGYTYARKADTERFDVRSKLNRPATLRLRVSARAAEVAQVTVNEQPASWKCVDSVGEPMIEIVAAKADGTTIEIQWRGAPPAQAKCPDVVGLGEAFSVAFGSAEVCEIQDPQKSLKDVSHNGNSLHAVAAGPIGHRTAFAKLKQGSLSWWLPIAFEIRPALEIARCQVDAEKNEVELAVQNNTDRPLAGPAMAECGGVRQSFPLPIAPHSQSAAIRLPFKDLVPGTNPISIGFGAEGIAHGNVVDWRPPAAERKLAFECIDLSGAFNDRVSEIFKHEYRSPRSPYCSLQIPLHGFGDWCYGDKVVVPEIKDDAIRAAAGNAGRFLGSQGIPLATPGPGDKPNVVFTSQWDNFPMDAVIPLSGRASHAWFLVAGSTHPMHSQLDNGEILVTYADGSSARLPLHNPTTWWPIEGDYDVKNDGFCIPARILRGSISAPAVQRSSTCR